MTTRVGVESAVQGAIDGAREGEQYRLDLEAKKSRNKSYDLQLKKLEQDQEYQALTQTHKQALGALLGSNGTNTEPLKQWYNEAYPSSSKILDITRLDNGGYKLTEDDGDEVEFTNLDDFATATFSFMHPDQYLKSKQDARNAATSKMPREYTTDAKGNVMYLEGPNATRVTDGGGKTVNAGAFSIGGRGGGSDSRPREVKIAEWLIANGIAKDKNDAWSMANRLRDNPQKASADLYAKMLAQRDRDYPYPDDPERPNDEQVWETAKTAIERAWATDFQPSYAIDPDKKPTPAPGGGLKNSYTAPNGKTVTRAQIEQTAKNRGMTPDEVVTKLGLK